MEKDLNNWTDFCGSNFLKASHVADEKDGFRVDTVDLFQDDEGNVKPRLILIKGENEYLFDMNVTNANFCKNQGIVSPKMLSGKTLHFKKVLVNSPKTKKEVESLRISKIE
jgi:hypothetical protein